MASACFFLRTPFRSNWWLTISFPPCHGGFIGPVKQETQWHKWDAAQTSVRRTGRDARLAVPLTRHNSSYDSPDDSILCCVFIPLFYTVFPRNPQGTFCVVKALGWPKSSSSSLTPKPWTQGIASLLLPLYPWSIMHTATDWVFVRRYLFIIMGLPPLSQFYEQPDHHQTLSSSLLFDKITKILDLFAWC